MCMGQPHDSRDTSMNNIVHHQVLMTPGLSTKSKNWIFLDEKWNVFNDN